MGENKSHRIEMKYCSSVEYERDEFFRIWVFVFRLFLNIFSKIRFVPSRIFRLALPIVFVCAISMWCCVEAQYPCTHTHNMRWCDRKDALHTDFPHLRLFSFIFLFHFLSFSLRPNPHYVVYVFGFSIEFHLRMWKIVWWQFYMAKNSKSLEINRNRA